MFLWTNCSHSLSNSSLCFSSLFLASSVCLSFASLSGMKLKWEIYTAPWEAGWTDQSSHPSFLGDRKSFEMGSFSWVWARLAWEMGWWQNEVVFHLFLCGYPQFLFYVLQKLPKRTPETSQTVLVIDGCLSIEVCQVMGKLCSSYTTTFPQSFCIHSLNLDNVQHTSKWIK